MKLLSQLTNRFSMLFLMQAYLVLLVINAVLFCFLGILPYDGVDILLSAVLLVAVAIGASMLFSTLIKAQASIMSATVSALILCLIAGPVKVLDDAVYLIFLAIFAIGSRYLVAWRGKHLFNPAALTVLVAALVLGQGASWWAGNIALLPLTLAGGIVILHKIQRWHLVVSFAVVYLPLLFLTAVLRSGSLSVFPPLLDALVLHGPLIFFMLVMLVEPLTAPSRRNGRIAFGAAVAATLVIGQNIPGVSYSLELSLLVGNLFAYFIGTSKRSRFTLDHSEQEAEGTYSFWFTKPKGFSYLPGQYMEWSLPHRHADFRGIRRWFTIASSPTEGSVLVTTRLSEASSSFKQALLALQKGQAITATGPEGDFVLPKDPAKPMIWIAGGIGITPFRSMAKYLIDKDDSRSVMLFYSNRTPESIAFADLFAQAVPHGVSTVYTVSEAPPAGWKGETGSIDLAMIQRYAPYYADCLYYISGPEPMVRNMAQMFSRAGIPKKNIKRDYFPGY